MDLENGNKKQLHISVRSLVEFIFREGDIDNRRGGLQSAEAMLEGSRIHRKIQGEQGEEYKAEVPLVLLLEEEEYALELEGRADGIFTDGEGLVWIDEIKGVYRSLDLLEEPVYVHQAQAMCYAYIYALQNDCPKMGVQMSYCNLDTMERKYFRQAFSFEELRDWFLNLYGRYKKWADFECRWKKIHLASIAELAFPFPYRSGQKKLVSDVYRTIARGKNLFIQAPTGVGKTVSTVFPAVKAVGEGLADRIFYLTAKTVTATVAKETFGLLMERGYRAKLIQLTAKEKLCLCEEMECNPVHCPYAKGHFDRVNDAVFDLLQRFDVFTREEILAQAKSFQVCPFELSLDVSSWSDDIVCDYNYAFDPNACLKRFFAEKPKEDYIFLVDEAHNLVERSREMYSAKVYKEDFMQAKRLLKPMSKRLEKLLEKCNKLLLSYKRECEKYVVYEDIGAVYFSFLNLAAALDEFLQKHGEFPGKKEVLDFYFDLRNFLAIYERADDHYVIYTEHGEDGRFGLKLFCVDPSRNLQQCLDKARSTVFFSATLLPIGYYKSLLSTEPENYAIYAESTFSEEQRLLAFGRDVSTRYTRRTPEEFRRIARYIAKAIRGREGNYMVFFPSYKLMEQVYAEFCKLEDSVEIDVRLPLPKADKAETGQISLVFEDEVVSGVEEKESLSPVEGGEVAPGTEDGDSRLRCLVQQNNLRESEREAFLAEFEKEREGTLVAFCVMGGIFGEGVDLKHDRLIGVIVVGTGLPQVSNEREILKNYFDEEYGNGFDYAFRYPGLNKVLQAAGRVIRTAEDRGIILLLDERFLQSDYNGLYPREWSNRRICTLDTVEELVAEFWKR